MEDSSSIPTPEALSTDQPTGNISKANNDTTSSNQEKAMETDEPEVDDDASSQATIDVAINGTALDNTATDTSSSEAPSTSDNTNVNSNTVAESSEDASVMDMETNTEVPGLANSDSTKSAADADNKDEEQPWMELVQQLVNLVKDSTTGEGASADGQQIVVIVGDDDAKVDASIEPLENGTNSGEHNNALDKMEASQDSEVMAEFRCWYCEEVFNSSADREEHEKLHTESKFVLLICQECGQSFRKSEEFEKHLRHCGLDNDEEPLNDVDADTSFSSENANSQSVAVTKGPMMCVFCEFFFDDKESLRKHLILRHQMVQDNAKPKMYACKYCEKNLPDRALILGHEADHTKSQFHCTCPHCEKKLPTAKDLKNHIRVMHTSSFNKLTCEYCFVIFVTRKDLMDHLKNTHNVKNQAVASSPSDTNYICGERGKEFDQKAKRQFDEHIATHTRDNLHTCDECGKTFVRARELGYHKARHRGEGKYICGLCKKNFMLKWDLKKHLKTVHDIDEDGSFDKKPPHKKPKLMDLTDQNIVMHDIFKVNPYICRICHATFEGGKELRAHRKTHAELDDGTDANDADLSSYPFICSFCSKGFQNKGDFVEHVGQHTKGTILPRIAPAPGSTVAELTTKKQSSPSSRRPKKELEKGEGIDFWRCCYTSCRRLTTTYHSKQEFAEHVKKHMTRDKNVCNYCGRCFARPRDLMYHKKESGVRPCKYMNVKPESDEASTSKLSEAVEHKCGCGEVFAGFKKFQLHVLSHKSTHDKMYCQYCGRNFPSKSKLLEHLQVNSSDPCEYASGKEVSVRIVENGDKDATPKKTDDKNVVVKRANEGKVFDLIQHVSPESKASPDKPYLREHETLHTKEANYPCDLCDRRFTRARELRYHQEKHDGTEPYSCDECSKRFVTKANYRTDMEYVHEKLYDREVQAAGVASSSVGDDAQAGSINSSAFKCSFCSKHFALNHFKAHMEIVHDVEVNVVTPDDINDKD